MDERVYARYMADIDYFHAKFEANPDSKYYIPIAVAYNKLEKYQETIELCKPALERFPTSDPTKTLLAEAYAFTGHLEEAKDLLFDIITENDNNYKAFKLLGIVFKANEEIKDALKYFKAAYLRAPEDLEVKKIIEDLGGSVSPDELMQERKSAKASQAEEDNDEEAKTYLEIDKHIKNAEMIMADFVSDSSITSKNMSKAEKQDKTSALISDDELEKLLQKAAEAPSDNKSDIVISPSELNSSVMESFEPTIPEPIIVDNSVFENIGNDSLNDFFPNDSSDSLTGDLLSALGGSGAEVSEGQSGQKEEVAEDEELLSALSAASEETENDTNDDLASALSAVSEETDDDSYDDLAAALSSVSSDEAVDKEDDLLAALSSSDDEPAFKEESDNDLIATLSFQEEENEEKPENEAADELLALLGTDAEESSPTPEIISEPDVLIENEILTDKHIEHVIQNEIQLKDIVPDADFDYENIQPVTKDDLLEAKLIIDDSDGDLFVSEGTNINDDLGESAPFSQSGIFEEIMDASGINDTDDEEIISQKHDTDKNN